MHLMSVQWEMASRHFAGRELLLKVDSSDISPIHGAVRNSDALLSLRYTSPIGLLGTAAGGLSL